MGALRSYDLLVDAFHIRHVLSLLPEKQKTRKIRHPFNRSQIQLILKSKKARKEQKMEEKLLHTSGYCTGTPKLPQTKTTAHITQRSGQELNCSDKLRKLE
jgi:hypothetical protein